jgi:hypothetical protein
MNAAPCRTASEIAMTIKKLVPLALLAVSAAACAADDNERALRFAAGIGLTNGGKTLINATFTDGTTEKVTSGGLVHLYVGGEYSFTPNIAVQANVGYHVHDTSPATNGSLTFSRVPVELLGYYKVTDHVRLGGGLRYLSDARLKGTGVASDINVKFKSTTGAVIEGEYLFTRNIGVKLRYVSEKYKAEGDTESISGNHGGLYLTGYF